MTGHRTGSLAHWLSTFEVGEVRWRELDRDEPMWIQRPPPNRTRTKSKFSCHPFCAVPVTDANGDVVYLWRIERVA